MSGAVKVRNSFPLFLTLLHSSLSSFPFTPHYWSLSYNRDARHGGSSLPSHITLRLNASPILSHGEFDFFLPLLFLLFFCIFYSPIFSSGPKFLHPLIFFLLLFSHHQFIFFITFSKRYANLLPPILLKVGVAMTLAFQSISLFILLRMFCSIVLSTVIGALLYLSPFTLTRKIGMYQVWGLMASISITGKTPLCKHFLSLLVNVKFFWSLILFF